MHVKVEEHCESVEYGKYRLLLPTLPLASSMLRSLSSKMLAGTVLATSSSILYNKYQKQDI